MVDPVRAGRVQEKEIQSDLARLELAQALRMGNIYEIKARLPANVTVRDFENFMSDQWRAWKSQIIQDYQVYESEASVAEPRIADFAVHGEGVSLGEGEGGEFMKGMMMSLGKGTFKATKAEGAGEGEAAGTGEGEMPGSYAELSGMAEGTLAEWESFTQDMWMQIFDTQFVQDYQKKMGEVQQEAQRIIALAKSGQVDPEYVLIALAKVNVTKNGCLMTWLGKKAFMTNDTMNRVANDLAGVSPSDPRYYAEMQSAQAKTRDGSFQMQMLLQDMQKVMQDVAGVLEQVHGFMGEINRTRREIIQKFTAT